MALTRYSQFLALHQQLSVQHHGSQLQGFVFPKKQLTNNFHPDVLEARQSGFKELLNRIAGSKQLCSSPPVLTFLTKFELEEGKRKFLKGEWQVAAQMLAKVREIRALLGVSPSMPLTLVLLASLVEGSYHDVALPYLEEVSPGGSNRMFKVQPSVTEVGSKVGPRGINLPSLRLRHCIILYTEGVITVTPCQGEVRRCNE